MVPMGYLYKQVVAPPDWIRAPQVRAVFSVSGCVSPYFADYIDFWKHNGYWLFDSPDIIEDIAAEAGISLHGMQLFYYEVYPKQFSTAGKTWGRFAPEASFTTAVRVPEDRCLRGFDVVSFSVGTSPECSPLSCNSLAGSLGANEYCLFPSFEAARAALEGGAFDGAEPGPYRILAVYPRKNPQIPTCRKTTRGLS